MTSWPAARGWNKRIEGGSISTSRNDSPPCLNPLASQLLQLLSSHGLLYLCLGWLRWPVTRINKREVGPRLASLHPIARPPPQSVRYLHLYGVHTLRPLMMMLLQTSVLWTPPLARKGEGAKATEVAEVGKARIVPILPDPLLLVEGEGKRRMYFLVKSRSQSLVGKRAIQVMSPMPSDSGLGASPITGTTMRTLT